MRTITEQRKTIDAALKIAEDTARLDAAALAVSGSDSFTAATTAKHHKRSVQTVALTIDTALAEVPRACRERIEMWSKVIARSSDDDEIRDAQAAQSELRWLLLQLEGEA